MKILLRFYSQETYDNCLRKANGQNLTAYINQVLERTDSIEYLVEQMKNSNNKKDRDMYAESLIKLVK
jgi:hypothetical protein